jgi:heat-inducible transcriptional repressor
VVLRSPTENRRLLKLRFIATRPGEVLAVVVFEDTTVENRFVRIDKPITDAELDRLHGLLEEAVPGHTLGEVRDVVARGMSERRDELKALHELGHVLLSSTETSARPAEVVIEGQALLLDKPEFGNVERARELLLALDARERLVGLLDRTLASDRVQVFLGEETTSAVGYPVSVVATRYQERGGPAGAVGVIGPTRMDYPLVVPLVAAAAEAMSTALARSQEPREGKKQE